MKMAVWGISGPEIFTAFFAPLDGLELINTSFKE
jgi:hypothetical protein